MLRLTRSGINSIRVGQKTLRFSSDILVTCRPITTGRGVASMLHNQNYQTSWTGEPLPSTEKKLFSCHTWNLNRLIAVGGTAQLRRSLTTDKPGMKSFAPVMEGSKNIEKDRVSFLVNTMNVSLLIAAIAGAPFVFK